MHLSKSKRYISSILTGLLLVVSFPNTGSLAPVALLALAPLLMVEHYIYEKRYRNQKVFTHAFISFLIFNFGTAWWIMNAEFWSAFAGLFLNSALMATFFQFFVWTKRFIGQKEGYIGFVFYWLALEYFHLNWDFSFPWLNLGNVFSTTPSIIQWYSYSGTLGGTLWILLSNLLVFKIIYNLFIKKEKFRIQTPLIWLLSVLIVLPLTYSIISYIGKDGQINTLNKSEVIITQPNIDPYSEKWTLGIKEQLNTFLSLADSLVTEKTDFVLAPETAIAYAQNEDKFQESSIYEYINNKVQNWQNASLLTGVSTYRYFQEKQSIASIFLPKRKEFLEQYNSSLMMDKNPPRFIHKSKLVMGAEMIPFEQYFPFLGDLAIDNGGPKGTLGVEKEAKIFQSKGVRIAPVVCYESVYGDWISQQCRKGAQAIFIITNDAWWGDTPGYRQHLNFARLRAIENNRWVARSANTGSSAIINSRGDIVKQTKYNTRTAIKGNIALNSDVTFYTTYGDVIGRSSAFAFFLILLFTGVKYIRKLKDF